MKAGDYWYERKNPNHYWIFVNAETFQWVITADDILETALTYCQLKDISHYWKIHLK